MWRRPGWRIPEMNRSGKTYDTMEHQGFMIILMCRMRLYCDFFWHQNPETWVQKDSHLLKHLGWAAKRMRLTPNAVGEDMMIFDNSWTLFIYPRHCMEFATATGSHDIFWCFDAGKLWRCPITFAAAHGHDGRKNVARISCWRWPCLRAISIFSMTTHYVPYVQCVWICEPQSIWSPSHETFRRNTTW